MKIKRTISTFIIFLVPFVPGALGQNAPTIQNATFSIEEYARYAGGTRSGTLVGQVAASDQDGDALSFDITGGNTDGGFTIDASGNITVSYEEPLDFEVNPVFTLTVQVSDDETPPKTATATVIVNLINVSPNDLCTNATTINIGETVTGSTYDATLDWNVAPNCGSNRMEFESESNGVWYKLMGNGETITLNTCTGNKYRFDDTGLAVYRGSCLTGLVCVAGNEDAGVEPECSFNGRQSRLKFPSEQGVEYFIIVDANIGSRGVFDLTTSSEPTPTPPANDHCENAISLTVHPIETGTPTTGDNTNAFAYTGRVSCSRGLSVNDVWYTFNSGPNVVVEVTTTSITAGFVRAALYDHCRGDEIKCTDKFINTVWEVKPNTDYWIQVWNSEQDEGSFTIKLNDGFNEAPTVKSPVVQISKYRPEGFVLEIEDLATDNDGHALQYSFNGGNAAGVFAIDEETGEIKVADANVLRTSAATTYDLTVKVDDLGPGDFSTSGTVSVIVIDNVAPVIEDKSVTIDENPEDGDIVTEVNITDGDGDGFSYEIIEGNIGGAFTMSNELEIIVDNKNPVNFEINPVFDLKVKVTDKGPLTLSDTAAVTITLNNINDKPVVEDISTNISQNAGLGFAIDEIAFVDDDEGQTHTYTITEGNDDDIFSINPLGGLFINNPTNLSDNGPGTYNLTVEVTDNGTPAQTGTASITIAVFNNNPPLITTTSFQVEENSDIDDVIGTLSATDIDGDNLTFSLLDDGGAGVFTVNADGEVRVADNAQLDYESNMSFDILVRVEDDGEGPLYDDQLLQIEVTDVNEAPTRNGYMEVYMSYDVPDGFVVATIKSEDPDNDVLTFSIEDGNEDNVFSINEATGVITVADASLIDVIGNPAYVVKIDVTDGELVSSSWIQVLIHANDLPELTVNTFEIDENSENGTLLGQLTSEDIHPIIKFEISGEENHEFFVLDEKTGELRLESPEVLDFETNQQFEMVVILTDGGPGGGFQTEEMISIIVNDVNEFSPVLDAIGNKSTEQASGLTFTVTATDEDGAAELIYALDNTSNDKGMSINANTGVFNWTPGYDQFGTHTVEVSVDDGDFSDTETITIEVLRALGLEDALQHGFAVYPNPAVSAVDLSLDNAYTGEVIVRVLDLAGKELMRKDMIKSQSKLQDKVDVSALGAGIYFVELNMKATEKLVQRVIKH